LADYDFGSQPGLVSTQPEVTNPIDKARSERRSAIKSFFVCISEYLSDLLSINSNLAAKTAPFSSHGNHCWIPDRCAICLIVVGSIADLHTAFIFG
jgi:hypothetical protein